MPAAAHPLVQLSLHPECDVSVLPMEFFQGRNDNFNNFILTNRQIRTERLTLCRKMSCQPTYLVRGVDGCFYLDWPGQRSVQRVWVGHVLVHARDQTVVVSPSVIPARDLLVDEIVVGQRQLPTKIDWKPWKWNYICEKEPAGGFKLTFVCIRQFDGVFVGNARKKEVGLFLFRNIFQRHLLALRWVVSLLVADWEILKIHKTSKRSRQAEEAG